MSLFISSGLISCKYELIQNEPNITVQSSSNATHPKIINVRSRENLNKILESAALSGVSTLATNSDFDIQGDGEFISLYTHHKLEYFSKLSQSELALINSDEEILEFCLADSIIADYQLSQLLNANREIQIGDTIYRYIGNGVGFTSENNYDLLNSLDSIATKIIVTSENVGKTIMIEKDLGFIPIDYEWNHGGDSNPRPGDSPLPKISFDGNEPIITPGEPIEIPTLHHLYCMDGPTIPTNNVRDIDFNQRGDGGWLHYLWNRLFGRNIVAINYFSDNRKLTFSLSDQNYIIYRKVSAELKLQKKVLGIWWNIKADEMYIGWDAFTLEYYFKNNPTKSINPFTNHEETPHVLKNPIENHSSELLFTLAPDQFDFNTSNYRLEYINAVDSICEEYPEYVFQEIDFNPRRMGLAKYNSNSTYITIPSGSERGINCTKMEHKFYFNCWVHDT